MTSPYITEAMRRRELPVRVRFVNPRPNVNEWRTYYPGSDNTAIRHFGYAWADTPEDAVANYLAAINELSKEN